MTKNVAVGILRPPHVFFYEIDLKDSFSYWLGQLKIYSECYFSTYSIFRTKHGYHVMAYPYSKRAWDDFCRGCPSDFTMKLKPRWNKKNPQVLRISEKWDSETGKVVSPAPKFICGNFFLDNIQKYKVMYYAK